MRVLKVVQAYYPFQEKGGPVVKVRALARGLARRGHEVTVLTADLGLRALQGSNTEVERCEWGWRSKQDGVEAIYLSTLGHYRALTLNPRVIGFCRASLGRFDLVHFYGLYDLLGPAVSYFCRRQNVPYVVEPMGMYRPIDRSFRLKLLWHRSIGNTFWRNAAEIVATSEMEQQELLADGVPPAKLVVRYNGIDPDSFTSLPRRGGFRAKWHIPPEEPLILFLSRLIPRKGADILIEAFARACPEAGRLVIAGPEGEPGYRAYLEKCAKESGVEARVLFTGAVYDEEKKALLADADLFALPSRYENFANAAAEAMACGIPVVITDACGIRSLVEGRAGLVIPAEKGALADALGKLIHDKGLYARLKEGCHRAADQLSWDRLSEQMEGYYAEVLATSHGAH
ncbi:MAG: glycosyltransferase [Acidobacteriia bacterium]|nr:glycosyltransferase [Terriglobia bacterium]